MKLIVALLCVAVAAASDYDALLNNNGGSFIRKSAVRPLVTSVQGHLFLQQGVALDTATQIDLTDIISDEFPAASFQLNADSDALPDGLVLDAATGIIAGTPSTGVNATIKIDACDNGGLCATLAPFKISVSTLVTTPTCSAKCGRDTRGPCQIAEWFDNNCYEYENELSSVCPANLIDCSANAEVVTGWTHSTSPSVSYTASVSQTRSKSAQASFSVTRTQSTSSSSSSQPSRSRSFSVSPTRTRSITASTSKSRSPRMSFTRTATPSNSGPAEFIPTNDCEADQGICGDRTCTPSGGVGDGYTCEKNSGCQFDFGEPDPCPGEICKPDEGAMTFTCVPVALL
jgi:hypothetical protein